MAETQICLTCFHLCSVGFLTFGEAAVRIFQFISLPRELSVTRLKWTNATEIGSVCYAVRQRRSDSQNNVDVSSCHNPCLLDSSLVVPLPHICCKAQNFSALYLSKKYLLNNGIGEPSDWSQMYFYAWRWLQRYSCGFKSDTKYLIWFFFSLFILRWIKWRDR